MEGEERSLIAILFSLHIIGVQRKEQKVFNIDLDSNQNEACFFFLFSYQIPLPKINWPQY